MIDYGRATVYELRCTFDKKGEEEEEVADVGFQ